MMLYRMIVLFMLALYASPILAELELDEKGFPKQDMLKAFEPFTGRLVVESNNKPTDLIPEPIELTGEQEGKYILDGTMFQFRSNFEVDGVKTENIFLYGYDRIEGSYCCWYFQQGAVALKYRIEWAEDGQSFKQVLLNPYELGYSIETQVELDGGKTLRWFTKVMTNDGKSVLDQTGKLTPADGDVEFPQPELKEDDKLSMFRSYAGRWKSVTKGKATQVVEEPYEVAGYWVQTDILGGEGLHMLGSADVEGNPYTYEWIYLYDSQEKAYVAWFNDSRGVHTKMYGDWSEDDKTMTWTLDDPEKHGVMVTIVDDVSDPGRLGFTFKMEANDGTLIMEEAGYGTQAKEE